MIVKTRAVVLREIKYRDQSKICTLFTREFGKITVILKGARNPKSRLSGKFSPGSVLDIVLYRKPNREVQLVSEGSLVHSPLTSEPHMERFAAMYRIVDMVSSAVDGEEKNLPLFELLEGTLEALYRTKNRFELLVAWFLLRLVSIMGFEPSLLRCVFSDQEIAPVVETMRLCELLFVMNPGGIALPGAALRRTAVQRAISPDAYRLLCDIAASPLSDLEGANAGETETTMLCSLLDEYCALHLEHVPRKRNVAVVAQMLSK
ncbi:MAG: DNA repair protein RecO [Chlorobium sp.]|uniref:DNA repair protein RecO n=1 Tax=Chlorobium sp. TaxID=1095 RepID=UPI0025BEA024|nr:DNA repair protein RecO [Chlorobium sp.]MCF8383562.1 DNA repair protein RecO [Chlorobium sp.]